ncbi:MAG: GTPase HflX [Hyphomicrobiaceae bacterium]
MVVPYAAGARARLARTSAASGGEATQRGLEDRRSEAIGLATAIDLEVVAALLVPLATPSPATLLGSGKVKELGDDIAASEVDLVIVDQALTPGQQRNLERAWSAKVIDRTGLILEIFGHRARTREGRLQVELAHLTYQRSRLVRSWTHLERQRGGFGFLGGPGETQIETDRRLLQERIVAIRKELDGVVRTRELHRIGRRRVPYPIVAIVGYTNAGKSTLFNRLTGADVLAMDQVFATLDPTMREVALPSGRKIILSDTVGFISDLPTSLVAAFRATLEEVLAADLILHVRDIAHPESAAQKEDVERVLGELGAGSAADGKTRLEVWNKIDTLNDARRSEIEHAAQRSDAAPVLISAATGEGIERLLAEIERTLSMSDDILVIDVPASAGHLRHWLYENTEVLARDAGDDGIERFRIRLERSKRGRLEGRLQEAGLRLGAASSN